GIEPTPSAPDFWDILFCGQIEHLRQLVQTILPRFSILDPACGTGTLLAVMQHRLVDIYSVLIGHLHHCPDSQLNIWLKGLQAESPSLLQTICRRILTSLYGVDISPVAVDIARLQLCLGLVGIAQQPQDIEPLPSLDFNIVMGNSLVGLIRVDEAGFDRLQAPETILQGNLLQPLAAETYRTILSEKNIALEHYRSQAYVLEELQQEIPHYAQLEFFRTHINRLDARAQAKLNELLLSEFSQTLGIQFKESQLTNPPRRRRLRLEDLEVLQPFHWGYHFNHILAQTGFDIILSRPPQGPFRPTTQEFLQRFQDLASQKNITIRTFKTAKRSLLNADPETANAWLFYHSQYAFVTDYFYRSPEYDHQSPLIKGKRQRTQLRQHWLFIERCFNLLAPQGTCGLVVSDDIRDSPRGVALRSLLETQTDSSLVSLPSH
ncbi:MAG: ATP-binding protein, partial [Cyanobacteria bacterium P01_D01_bin.2]